MYNDAFFRCYPKDLASIKVGRKFIGRRVNFDVYLQAISTPVLFEYEDVLKRNKILKKIGLSTKQVEDILDLLVLLADKRSIYYRLRPNLLDENDNLFVECAFTSNSQYLITSNTKDFHFGRLKSHPFKVITPGDFYYLWRCDHD